MTLMVFWVLGVLVLLLIWVMGMSIMIEPPGPLTSRMVLWPILWPFMLLQRLTFMNKSEKGVCCAIILSLVYGTLVVFVISPLHTMAVENTAKKEARIKEVKEQAFLIVEYDEDGQVINTWEALERPTIRTNSNEIQFKTARGEFTLDIPYTFYVRVPNDDYNIVKQMLGITE